MPTAELSWDEWHLTDSAAIDTCAEDLFNAEPSYRSTVGRMRDDSGNALRHMDIFLPDNTKIGVDVDQWVVLIAGMLQVMTPEQYTAWRG